MSISIQNLVDHDPSLMRCPNENCAMPIECGNMPTAAEAEAHLCLHALKAQGAAFDSKRSCTLISANAMSEMCDDILQPVRAVPYHIGVSCEEWALTRPQQCRYCSVPLIQPTTLQSLSLPEDCVDEKKGCHHPPVKDDGHGEWECVVETEVAYRNSLVVRQVHCLSRA